MGVDTSELRALSVSLNGQRSAVVERVLPVVTHWGQLLQTRWKENAHTGDHAPGLPHIPGTGPGPNVATGDFLRTIDLEINVAGSIVEASAGSNAVQAAALEFGNPRTNQPPYPSAFPALDWAEPLFEAAIAELSADL